ncbi:MAG: hypothetical protein WBN18_03610 [Flavobacteriaceae bacterium]
MLRNAIFNDAQRPAYDFKFKREVATVFDDMAVRSASYYIENSGM